MAGSIDIHCPKCQKKIVQSLSALDDDPRLVCPGCGITLDFEEVKRGIRERVARAKTFAVKHVVKATIKI